MADLPSWALDALACPRCQGALAARPGALYCAACGRDHPVRDGVPALLPDAPSPADFEAQWALRLDGRFERPSRLYGADPEALTRWLVDRCLGAPSPGDLVLDAGCGSGEKAARLAALYPEARVLALDLTPTLARSAARFRHVPNLAFVRGDLLAAPLRTGAFQRVLSWGVVHHTADTARAVAHLARAVAPGGRLVLWLYPHPAEAPVWRPYYWLRDVVHLGRGHRIPPLARLWLARAECAALAPPLWAFHRLAVRPFARGAGFLDLDALSPRELYDAAVFLLYDALSPRYHDRPHTRDVRAWFARAGFGAVRADGYGHHWAEKAR